MAVGLSTTNLADKILEHLRGGTSWTKPTSLWVRVHIGDPGASGTANGSAVTTRSQVTFAASSGGAIALTGTPPTWTMTATETISHISVWDASTAGNFLWSAALSASKSVQANDALTLTSCGLSLGTLAA